MDPIGMQKPPLLVCRDLTKQYDAATCALWKMNLTLYPGRIIGLLGPNGSGKSTLIKLINGLLTPTSGDILVNGLPIGKESRLAISYLPERTYLLSTMTAESQIRFFSDFYPNFDAERAYRLLASLGINPQQKLSQMSKGMKEKVQLILVMSRRADLYILDEPIAGVDPAARDFILNTVLKNYDPNASILVSTHLISDIEPILDDAVFLANGQVRLAGSVNEIRQSTGKSLDQLFREVFRC